MDEVEIEAAFLVALAGHGVTPDIGEALTYGNGSWPPGALRKALRAVIPLIEAAAFERAAGVADSLANAKVAEIGQPAYYPASYVKSAVKGMAQYIATAIRSLTEKPHGA